MVLAYVLYSRVALLLGRAALARADGRRVELGALRRLQFHPADHPLASAARARAEHFSVYYEFVTGKTNWGPHSFWVALIVETGLVGLLLFVVFLRYVYLRLRAARLLGRMLGADGRYVRALDGG